MVACCTRERLVPCLTEHDVHGHRNPVFFHLKSCHNMLELHVYGAGLGLPSIEVKCLAAIALFQACFDNSRKIWALIASNDPSVSPFNELPALRDGDVWITGYRNIADYIQEIYTDKINHDKFNCSLNDDQSAKCEAFLSFIESRGLPLLDLSIYVSSDNYTTVTRSELSEILPWPQSWSVPQSLRDAARKRSEHLGLSGLDVDAVREKELKKENEGIAAAIPKSLRMPKKSVTSLLGSNAEQTRFRLEAVTADFFEPLEEQLANSDYFLGSKQTVLDCLALAVFAQMSLEELPQPWLSHALQKHRSLWDWTRVNKTDVFLDRQLPWQAVKLKSWSAVALSLVDYVAETVPLTLIRTPARMQTETSAQSTGVDDYKQKYVFYSNAKIYQDRIRGLITATTSSAGLVGLLVYMGVLTFTWPARRSGPARHGFGEAGAFLGLR